MGGTRGASTIVAGPSAPPALVPSQATGSGQKVILRDINGQGGIQE